MVKALLGLVLSILAIPVVGVLMLFDYVPNIPVDTYEYVPTDLLLAQQIQASVTTLQSGELAIDMQEQFINQLLYSYFVENVNPSYAPGRNCNSDSCNVLVSNENDDIGVAITGIWVRLRDDIISVNVGIRSTGIPFQSRVRLDFEVTDNPDLFEIKYARLQLGNIPLPAFAIQPIVNAIINESNVESTLLGGDGVVLDLETLSLQINKQTLVDNVLSDDVAFIASLLFEEQLVRFAVDEETSSVRLYFDVDKITANRDIFRYDGDAAFVIIALLSDVLDGVDFDVTEGLTLERNHYYISENGLNQILTAQFQEASIASLIDSAGAELLLELEPLWIELTGANAVLVFPVVFMDQLIPIEFVVRSIPSDNDLVLQVESIMIGRDDSKLLTEFIRLQGDQVQDALGLFSLGGIFEVDAAARQLRVPVAFFDQAVQELVPQLRVERIAIEDGRFLLQMNLA